MTDIIIVGSQEDCGIEQLIKTVLSQTYRISYLKNGFYSRLGAGYELICIDCGEISLTGIESPIILAKKEAALTMPLPENSTAIISAENENQLSAVKSSGVCAITCGISPTSTISFTSETEEKLTVSLNRSISALSGRTVQPLEIPINKSGFDSYTLMSFVALRLLLDDFDSELGKLI